MGREFHVRFCEGLGVKFPRPTRPAPAMRSWPPGPLPPPLSLRLAEGGFAGGPHGAVEERTSAELVERIAFFHRRAAGDLRRKFDLDDGRNALGERPGVALVRADNHPATVFGVHGPDDGIEVRGF